MKYLKLTDLLLQGMLLLTSLLMLLSKGVEEAFVLFYFVLGGWQLLSFLIHFIISTESWYHRRYRLFYGKTIAVTFALAAVFFLLTVAGNSLLLYYLFAMLFITPLYAVVYGIISYREWKSMLRKELIHLKK